jgi:hypothetical protein
MSGRSAAEYRAPAFPTRRMPNRSDRPRRTQRDESAGEGDGYFFRWLLRRNAGAASGQVSIEIILDTSQGAIHAHGKVVAAQTGMGMGIAFTAISPEDFEKLREIAPMAEQRREREHSSPRPAVAVAAVPTNGARASQRASQVAPTTQEVLESILRILLRKGIVSEEEMAEEFEKLITTKS